jgi:protein O-GlcNAc transferase
MPKPPASTDAAELRATLQDAVALHQKGQMEQAQAKYQEVLRLQPRHFDALHLSGIIAAQTKDHARAVTLIGQALEINPTSAVALFNYGIALTELKRFDEALASYERALHLKPDYAEAHNNLANTLRELGRLDAAVAAYDQAIRLNASFVDAYVNRGNALRELGRHQAALADYDSAIHYGPASVAAHFHRAIVLQNLQQTQPALASLDKTLQLQADHVAALFSRGRILMEAGRREEALESFDAAVRFKPDYAEAHVHRGLILYETGQFEAALACYDQAIRIKPDHANAHCNRGTALYALRRCEAAIASYGEAIRLAPDYADAYNNRGVAERDLKRLAAALISYNRALEINPDHADAYCNRGNVLSDLKDLGAAAESYDKALSLRPDYPFLRGTRLHTKIKICDWGNVERDIAVLAAKLERGEKASPPFPVLALTDSLSLQRNAAAAWANDKSPLNVSLRPLPKSDRPGKIRVGYYSADFFNHATAYLMAGLFERHDRERFEFYGFSFGPDIKDEMRARIAAAFDKFIDVRTQSDKDVAVLSRSLGIDIAVDLKGFTQDERAGIFAHRAAPIQASYIGYPGTMAVSYMDYIVGDPTVIPEHHREHYTEKVVYLPHTYQVNDTRRKIADRIFARAELGLPDEGFVFCCFNNTYKIMPETFGIWMRILKRVKGSVLWLLEDNAVATGNLRQEAQRRGVDPNRVIFAPRMSPPEHLARHRAADLFLDTLPYNAHTTASDALWAGLPVLTCMGEAFAARVAASLLTAVGLPEMITSKAEDYEALAVALANDPARLGDIKKKLASHRTTQPLFDTKLLARHIEDAYAQMHARHQAGLAPDHIHVGA